MIFFRKKLKKVIDVKEVEQRNREEPLDLEKGDIPAIILAAFLTVGPVLLGIIAVVLLLWWVFT